MISFVKEFNRYGADNFYYYIKIEGNQYLTENKPMLTFSIRNNTIKIRITVNMTENGEIFTTRFFNRHNTENYGEMYNKLLAFVEDQLDLPIDEFTDGHYSYLSEETLKSYYHEFHNSAEQKLMSAISASIAAEIDKAIVENILKLANL